MVGRWVFERRQVFPGKYLKWVFPIGRLEWLYVQKRHALKFSITTKLAKMCKISKEQKCWTHI